jgi:SAM-dependent methyltransferase/uncharacterized protein YbaR (Trm112 family)
MRRRVLEFLACPVCQGELELRDAVGAPHSEVISGTLACATGHAFAISEGVPRLRLDQKLDEAPVRAKGDSLAVAASFGAEWSHFDYEQDLTYQQSVAERRELFLKEVGMSAEELKGKVVLDAGCGNGTLSVGISQFGCEVVAIDVSPSVDVAYRQFAGARTERTYFVQGDLMNPPLRNDVFDVIFSSGVLHHNPDTREALRAIARSLRPGGRIYIWVYGHIPGIAHSVKELFRRSISPLPSAFKHAIVGLWLPQAMLRQYLRRALGRDTPQDRLKWSERFVLLLDHYTPRYRWEHTPDEVMTWYRELGYEGIAKTEDREWGFGCAASKRSRDAP